MLAELSTGLSTISFVIACAAFWTSRQNIALPRRKLTEIETELGDVEHALHSLRSTDKRLNARIGMREAREKLAASTDEAERDLPAAGGDLAPRQGEDPLAWKRRVRIAMNNGALKHGR